MVVEFQLSAFSCHKLEDWVLPNAKWKRGSVQLLSISNLGWLWSICNNVLWTQTHYERLCTKSLNVATLKWTNILYIFLLYCFYCAVLLICLRYIPDCCQLQHSRVHQRLSSWSDVSWQPSACSLFFLCLGCWVTKHFHIFIFLSWVLIEVCTCIFNWFSAPDVITWM